MNRCRRDRRGSGDRQARMFGGLLEPRGPRSVGGHSLVHISPPPVAELSPCIARRFAPELRRGTSERKTGDDQARAGDAGLGMRAVLIVQ